MRNAPAVNNAVYDDLGDRWYEAQDDPIALLRAEHQVRLSWIERRLRARYGGEIPWDQVRVLDLGCGGGFLSNDLAARGAHVTGIDQSAASLETAARYDRTGTVSYRQGDVFETPVEAGEYDVVCALDFLEHVEDPAAIFAIARRALGPNGHFFFHTFNRTPIAWLLAIKGLEWFVKNTPEHLHVYRLFIKPKECSRYALEAGLTGGIRFRGVRPVVFSMAFWRLLTTGLVDPAFRFTETGGLVAGYLGEARAGD